ncbi:MAG TPA: hypothetical protein VM409_07025, partial [Chloroflexia bacterium]|nr:hypothetical protein [Chloroflexia bacterium]
MLNSGIQLGLLLSIATVLFAYQIRPVYDIQIGSATDAPLLQGFNTREVTAGAEAIPFRWTTASSRIVLQDVGRQDFDVILRVNGFRPEGQPAAHLTVKSGERLLLDEMPPSGFTDYTFHAPQEAVQGGTLSLNLESNAFIPPGDPNPRPLGVLVSHLLVSPASGGWIEPPVQVLTSVVGASALAGLLLALMGWGAGLVVGGA